MTVSPKSEGQTHFGLFSFVFDIFLFVEPCVV